jgi:hypothetical protein
MKEVTGAQFVRDGLVSMEMHRSGPMRPSLLADRDRLHVVTVPLDGGDLPDLDRRVARERWRAIADDVAEEDDLAEAERGVPHSTGSGLVLPAGILVWRGRAFPVR